MPQRNLLVIRLFAFGFVLTLTASSLRAQTYTDLHDFDCQNEGCSPSNPDVLVQGIDGELYGTLPDGNGPNTNVGTVFKSTLFGTVTILHNFVQTDGRFPDSGLTLGVDGNLYGTTSQGGTFGNGLVFTVSPDDPFPFTVLHNFAGDVSEGIRPGSPPVQGLDGNFYGVTELYQRAYRVSASGKFKLLPAPPGQSVAPLVLAIDGNFYGTTYTGGNINEGTVFKMSPSGSMKIIYSFDYNGGYLYGVQPAAGLVQGSDGIFYGTTPRGGPVGLGDGVVFKMKPSGALTVLHGFDRAAQSINGYNPIAGVVLASDGNLYGTASSGGTNGVGVLYRITKKGDYTVIRNFDNTGGAYPDATPMQHTNGKIYGLTRAGGKSGNYVGVLYSLDAGLPPFVKLTTMQGKAGQTVQILGQGLTGTANVKFGSGSANFTVVSDTYLTAVVPTNGVTGFVTVTTPSGTLLSINQKFKVLPAITSFTPTSGPVGTKVTITGSGFIGATEVTFGGVKATSYTVNSGTQITATVPTGAKTGNIAVTTPGGSASKGTFTVF